jgi:hypothetical protein
MIRLGERDCNGRGGVEILSGSYISFSVLEASETISEGFERLQTLSLNSIGKEVRILKLSKGLAPPNLTVHGPWTWK